MTSVLYSSGGYNTGGNQLRVELRNMSNTINTLVHSLSTVQGVFTLLNPDKATEISAAFQTVLNPQPASTPSGTPFPPRNNTVNSGATRVRP